MQSVHKNGKVTHDEHGNSKTVFKKYGEYEDSIENIVYNSEFVKKIIKNKIKFFTRKNELVIKYLKKLVIKNLKQNILKKSI